MWNERFRTHVPKLISIVAIAIFLDHALQLGYLTIDWIGVGLLLVIVLAPYAPHLRKLSVGDFEMEISPEIEKAKQNQSFKQDDKTVQSYEADNRIEDYLYSSLEEGPLIAVSNLRSLITSYLQRIARSKNLEYQGMNATRLVKELNDQNVIDDNLADSTEEILSLCSNAINTAGIEHDDALEIIELGKSVIFRIKNRYNEVAVTPKENTENISRNEVEEYRNSTYTVKSVIPTIKNPQLVIRKLDQDGLDEYLEGYHDFAEFIVEINRLD